MDGHDLLDSLQGTTEFESVGDAPHSERSMPEARKQDFLRDCITHVTAGNRKMPVLKAMTTTACERDCFYCPFRAGRTAMRRVKFVPEDLVSGFMQLYNAGVVEGMFLSSGVIRGGVTSQDSIIDVGTILREKLNFKGYLHLKIMPGAERDQVERTMQLADRVSANLEAPNAERLSVIAPHKDFHHELFTRLQWVEELRRQHGEELDASSTTEFVVGPAGESDLELLSTTEYLHRHAGLARAYFSAFSPVTDTPLENAPATSETRRLRLYQASFLLRDYAFSVEELPFEGAGDLPQDRDPKRAWADTTLRHNPVEINQAERQDLIRVPGIGVKGAERILRARRKGRLRSIEDLRAIGIANTGRLSGYVLLDGQRPNHQLPLF